MTQKIKVFSGTASADLAQKVVERLSIPLGKATVSRFADGEIEVQLLEEVREADVFIINSTHPPAENLLEPILLAEAAIGASAKRVTYVFPYMGYNRQDRKVRPRVPISARVVMRMLSETGAHCALCFDLHSETTAGFFDRMVVNHLYASIVALPYLQSVLGTNYVVAAPDAGGGPRAEAYAQLLGLDDYVVFSKRRTGPGQISKKPIKIIGDVGNKDVLLVDDMVDSGGTLVRDAETALKAGANSVLAYATHAVLSGKAVQTLDESPIRELVLTDTIHHPPEKFATKRLKITVLSMAELIAKAIRRIHDGESVSSLILKK